MSAQKNEHDATIGAIVLHDTLGKQRPVGGTAPDHSMQSHGSRDLCIPWICSANMRTGRSFQSDRIVAIQKIVVPVRVPSQRGIVAFRRERQGCAAAPASHHLGGEQLFLLRT